ncbi:hypothetical protein GCM10010218_04120 [Streptomyces mashuensis]|uniref:Uncharacterized protein n=1 Tax=Streptomyces mashuensis TaxID=33904 RepID=A0A919AU93_9ACTN|nr:hypothetical protein GCM10010218_04120 [Streptomyces mashuensis]
MRHLGSPVRVRSAAGRARPGPPHTLVVVSERKYPSEPEPLGRTCPWCHGSGCVPRVLAYSCGTHPFRGPAETVHRSGQCRHCRGSGVYASEQDPTLDHGGDHDA